MFIPAEHLSTASVNTAKAGQLLKVLDRGGAVIWIVKLADYRFAVFLTGENATHAFEIKSGAGWTGCLVGPVTVRVDPSSMNTKPETWCLKASGGSLRVGFQARGGGGFNEDLWAPVAAMETIADSQFYFTRWTAGIELNGEWSELVSVADGKLTTILNGEA